MMKQECPPPTAIGKAGGYGVQPDRIEPPDIFNPTDAQVDFLLALLDGAAHASAVMPWGSPGPIALPDDPAARRALIVAHLRGRPAIVSYCPADQPAQTLTVNPLALAALCPAADGLCRWCAIDLDSAHGHGETGLRDPVRAARYVAVTAMELGIGDGLIIARSKSGQGRHVWIIPPAPVPLDDAVTAVAAIVAAAYVTALNDVDECDCDHPFACADGSIADPGQSGAVEIFPRATDRPPRGWALCLPLAGAYADRGGGIIVDPLTDKPTKLRADARCDVRAWSILLRDARRQLQLMQSCNPPSAPIRRRAIPQGADNRDPMSKVPAYVNDFLDGRITQGDRNRRAFVAACALFGVGLTVHDVEARVIDGARRCGLPEREAISAVRSAAQRKQGNA